MLRKITIIFFISLFSLGFITILNRVKLVYKIYSINTVRFLPIYRFKPYTTVYVTTKEGRDFSLNYSDFKDMEREIKNNKITGIASFEF